MTPAGCRTMQKILFAVTAILLGEHSAVAQEAPEWELVTTGHERVSVFVNTRLVSFADQKAQAWVRVIPAAGSEMPFSEALVLWKINCAADTQAALSTTTYTSDRRVRSARTRPEAPGLYHRIVPGSYAAAVRDTLCPFAGQAH